MSMQFRWETVGRLIIYWVFHTVKHFTKALREAVFFHCLTSDACWSLQLEGSVLGTTDPRLCSQCADDAMAALHGHMVNGVRMKVMLADPPREVSHKRPRTY